jgi:CHAT domain-containing protein/tetratricopeptide (TPR) repeat protein
MKARSLFLAVALSATAPFVSRAGDECVRDYLELRRLIGKELYDSAFDRSAEMLRGCPSFPPLYEAIVELGLYTRDWDRSELIIGEQIREGVEVPLALYALASLKALRNDHAAAVRYCLEAIEEGLTYSGVFSELAYAYEKAFGHDEAISMLGRLSRGSPRSAGLHYAAALGLWNKGDFRSVVAHLREAVALDASQPRYSDALAVADLHLGYSRRKAEYIERRQGLARCRGDIAGSQFLASSLVSDQIYAGDRNHQDRILQQSTAEASEFGFVRWLGWSLQRLADTKGLENDFPEALRYAMLARSLGFRSSDNGLVMVATQRISSTYLEAGILDSALLYAQMRWSLTSRDRSTSDYVSGLSKIALILFHMGHVQLANEYCVEALAEADSRVVDPVTLAEVETTYGLIQERLGNVQVAARHHLIARKALGAEDPLPYCLAANSGNLGRTRMAEGFGKVALDLFEQELRTATRIRYPAEVATAQLNIGDLNFRWKAYRKSKVCYLRALKISRAIGSLLLEFESLNRLAILANVRNEPDEALQYYLEVERVGIASLLNGRTEFPEFASALKEKAHLELGQGRWLAGLTTLAATKLIELHPFLAQSVMRPRGQSSDFNSVDLRAAQIRHAAALRKLKNQIDNRTVSLSSRYAELIAMTEIVGAQLEITRIGRGQAKDPMAVWNTRVSNQGLHELTAYLRAHSVCVIQYLVREKELDILCMTPDTTVYGRLRIPREKLARAVHLMSSVLREGGLGVPLLHPSMARFDYQVAHELYSVLIKPMRRFMGSARRLVIVPDAFLAFVPFEALVKSFSRTDAKPRFLIHDFEVSYCWSLDQLELSGASSTPGASILVVANPGIGVNSLQVHRSRAGLSADFLRRTTKGDLPDSQGEATIIRDLFGRKAYLLIREEATKERVVALLPRFGVIHLATHGVADESHPAFVGLALGPETQNLGDGVLRLFELQRMELHANLVVLNGCNTARGAERTPMWNPASVFTGAGAQAVIGTLWDVQDIASREIICDFYTGVRNGLRASAALRSAKLDAIAHGRSHPVLWASHIFIGNPDVNLGYRQVDSDLAYRQSAFFSIGINSCVCASSVVVLILLIASLGRREERCPEI